jgi:cytochrome c biogenesis protein CcmG, thiol:disulfide interchange protein DsbE
MNKAVFVVGLAVTMPLLGLLLLNIKRDPTAITSPLIQKAAPDVRVAKLEGEGSLQISSLRGRPAVVNFWATWCIPCVQEHASLSAGARANPDVAFLGVVYEDTAENARGFLAQRGAAYSTYVDDDGKAAIAFGVYGVPETFFINAKGTIVDKYVGPLDDDLLREKLAAARQ